MVVGMAVMGVARFEQLFREAAGLDVDKDDLKRYNDFVDQKINDLLIMARATAKANGRDVIVWKDIPLTQGLQKSMHEFVKLDQDIELRAGPDVHGSRARSQKPVDESLERAFRIFDLLL